MGQTVPAASQYHEVNSWLSTGVTLPCSPAVGTSGNLETSLVVTPGELLLLASGE